jgi:hypothetical protein
MGYELRRWLADRLPAEVSSGERVLALEIADLANDRTRRAFGAETLARLLHRSGFADMKQVGKVLGKLAARGLELRAPITGKDGRPVRDRRGRPVFAAKGHGLEFLVPTAECPALRRAPARESFDDPPDGGPSESSLGRGTFTGDEASHAPRSSPVKETFEAEGPPTGARSSPARSPKVPPAGDPSPQGSPQVTSSLPRGTRIPAGEERTDPGEKPGPSTGPARKPDRFTARLMDEHTATADEVAAVLAAAERDGVHSPAAWATSTVGREDFTRSLTELRALPARKERPACGHTGITDPFSGGCLLCDIRTRRAAPERPRPEPATEDEAAAHALLAELLARGCVARERRERQKAARDRRPVRFADVIDPRLWEQREATITRNGGAPLPETAKPLEREQATSA